MNLAKATAAVLFIIGVFITGLDGQALTINEVMADPVGSDYYDEFIELYNYGDLAVTLSGYYLEINGYVDTLSFVADYGDVILPHSFALIMDRGYLVSNKSSSYEDLIPENTLLVTIQDSSLARTGLINTGASQIYLFNAQGDTISAVLTTAKPLSGYSWEKIIPEGTNQISNWGNSRNQRGTPGFWNSIAPRNYDVAIEGLKVVSPVDQIFPHQPIDVQFTVKNFGLKAATSVQIICGLDQNSDRQIDEIFYDEMIALAAGDSAMKNATIPGLSSGIYTILAEAIYAADERYDNNLDSLDIKILFSENCLIINEFMYYPATDGGEWVELLNISADTINLKKWMLSDNSTTIMLTGQDFYLPPQKYLVIVNDSTTFISYWGQVPFILDCPKTMPALNNTKDSIIIRDHSAHLIDGLEYSSAWGYRQGVSLERKNSFASSNQASNWSLSTDLDKATPGRRNSIDLRDYDLALDSVKVKPGKSPFQHNSPVTAQIYLRNNGKKPADSFKLNIAIINSFLGTVSDTTITIFSPLQSNESQTVAVTFNAIPGGLHQISAEILWSADETLTNNIANCPLAVGYPTGVLVINEIMFVPLAGQCEWFEIYNRSEITLDLNGWSFRDAMGKRLALADSSIAIKAGEYAVVAARSDFTLDYPEFQELLIVPTAFPTLNNTTDSLFLYDATDNIIDIICYRDSWGGGTGVSLERLDPAQPALNTGNWGGSLIIATPGQTNSIIKLDNDLAIVPSSFKFSKTLDAVGQKVSFSLKIKNVGRNPAENFSIKIYLDQNQDSCRQADELCWRQDINQSLKSDSTLIVT
ncbi:MAG TPA: lamin tail domain-containing protein, partial [Candidatus Marinimicrobia bacterium]|nr:lamin tail domain-containing protein [Candidatus Neomarinimicrobiota bacterium]